MKSTFSQQRESNSIAPHKPDSAGLTPAVATNFEGRKQPTQCISDELRGDVFRPLNFKEIPVINGGHIHIDLRRDVINGARGEGKQWFEIKNEAAKDDSAVEILIYDFIGKDFWSDEGVGAKDFSEALAKIPKDKNILVKINSPGGNVRDGIAIYTELKNRGDKVTTYITGAAISIASVIALAGKKVMMARTAQFMIHDPWSALYVEGTKEQILSEAQKIANALDNAKESILTAYADKTGTAKDDLKTLMTAETWMTGDTALASKFVDCVTDDAPTCNSFDLSSFRRVPEAFRKMNNSAAQGGGQSKHTDLMDKATIIALLKEHGVEVDASATIEQLQSKLKEALVKAKQSATTPAPAPAASVPAASAPDAATTNRIALLEAKYEAERKTRITGLIDGLIADRRLPAALRASYIERAMKDETILDEVAKMPQDKSGGEPIVTAIEATASIKDVSKHLARVGNEIEKDILDGSCVKATSKARQRAILIHQNLKRIGEIWNEGTNTIDATLQQDTILAIVVRAFERVLLPVSNFATVHNDVPLRGTNKVQIPFLALDATTPTDWNGANGYVAADSTNDNIEITVDKRKYLGLSYTSTELARQPFLMVEQQMGLKGESLAFAVWKDIWSIVKAASFGLADGTALGISTWPVAAAAMDSNKIIDLQSIADSLNWPTAGRLLFVNTPYDNFLKKDNAFKNALNFGGSEVLRQGMIPNILGFMYATNVNLQANGENLAGVIAQSNAIQVATSPIAPTPEVLRDGTQYSIAVSPTTGIAVEYRSFGDSQKDKSLKFIESNYGYAAGVAANLKRLTTA